MHEGKGTDGKSVPFRVGIAMHPPVLSVVIPTLNEAAALPFLLGDLAAQSGVALEVVVSDGGSRDATADIAAAELRRLGIVGAIVCGPAGRGQQLNAGAARAAGEWLLFLHADCRLPSPTAVADGLTALRRAGGARLAGHFALCFDLPEGSRDFTYFWGEVRARSGRPATILGDQGFLLRTAHFRELGGFREDLPVLEDALLAEMVRHSGAWCLLPARIVTSPRRFQAEGVRVRQFLNALLANFALIGWDRPLRSAPEVYRVQDQTRPLQLAPFLVLIDRLLREEPRSERLRLWYRTGVFVRGNAWQLPLKRAARRAFAAGDAPDAVPQPPPDWRWRWFEKATDHPLGYALAGVLTWVWFRSLSRRSAQGERDAACDH